MKMWLIIEVNVIYNLSSWEIKVMGSNPAQALIFFRLHNYWILDAKKD